MKNVKKLLVVGEGSTEQQTLNYAETLKKAIKDVSSFKQLTEQSNDN